MEVVCWLRATLALLPLLFAPAATNIDLSSSSSETGDLASLLTASLGYWSAGPAHLLLLGGAGRDDEAACRCQDLIKSGGGGDSLWRVVEVGGVGGFDVLEEALVGKGAAPDGVTLVVLGDGEGEEQSPFREAVKNGLMERATWLLPEGAFRPEDIKSRCFYLLDEIINHLYIQYCIYHALPLGSTATSSSTTSPEVEVLTWWRPSQ